MLFHLLKNKLIIKLQLRMEAEITGRKVPDPLFLVDAKEQKIA
jgi:hypothetical protein